MHPIEHLRHVARSGDEDASFLAEEAAIALGSLAFDRRALVPATRRLLEFHPGCAPLWWVCAEVLCATDPAARAREVADRLATDSTSDALAAALPGAATLATTGGERVLPALLERPDLGVRLVSAPRHLRYQLRRLEDAVDVTAYTDDDLDEALDGAALVVVEADALGIRGALLDPLAHDLASAAASAGVDVWVVAAEGRLLPGALFEALVAKVADGGRPRPQRAGYLMRGDTDDVEQLGGRRGFRVSPDEGGENDDEVVELPLLELAALDVVVGPEGPQLPSVALGRARCPVPPELLVGTARR